MSKWTRFIDMCSGGGLKEDYASRLRGGGMMSDTGGETMYVIGANNLLLVRAVMRRLYSEDRMSGDDMRDAAYRLRVALDSACELEE